jgi:hypothetical protein
MPSVFATLGAKLTGREMVATNSVWRTREKSREEGSMSGPEGQEKAVRVHKWWEERGPAS